MDVRRIRRRLSAIFAAVAVVIGIIASTTTNAAHASGTSVIRGSVWNDANRNGVFDMGESPFANIPIWVYSGSTYVSGATTDSNGNYQVTALSDGAYTVEIAAQTWDSMRDNWVPTTTDNLAHSMTINLSGSAVANFGFRQVVRSATMGSPISSYKGLSGFTANSYDDVVSAQALYNDAMSGQLIGLEAANTTLNFDSPTTLSDTVWSAAGGPPGLYSNFQATMYVTFDSWVTEGDETLFHEYGHAWSNYNAYITHQDPTYSSYLKARGLAGNVNLGTSWTWEPAEIFAEDYRQLFGSLNARSYPQANTQIPPAADVAGLQSFLQSTYGVSPYTQPAPTVSGVTPATSTQGGGNQVTVTGTDFAGPGWATSSVKVGGANASFTFVSPTQLTVILPPGTGQQNLTVTTSATSSSSTETSATSTSDLVTYVPAPVVTSVSPPSGSARGGTIVNVYGSGFAGSGYTVTSVSFGGLNGSKVTVVSPTQITVVSPPGSGTVDITVMTPGGASATSSADRFTYRKK